MNCNLHILIPEVVTDEILQDPPASTSHPEAHLQGTIWIILCMYTNTHIVCMIHVYVIYM